MLSGRVVIAGVSHCDGRSVDGWLPRGPSAWSFGRRAGHSRRTQHPPRRVRHRRALRFAPEERPAPSPEPALTEWRGFAADACNIQLPGALAMNVDMSHLQTNSGHHFDKMFVDMMIPHHKGALDMSRDALQKSQRRERKNFAQHAIATTSVLRRDRARRPRYCLSHRRQAAREEPVAHERLGATCTATRRDPRQVTAMKMSVYSCGLSLRIIASIVVIMAARVLLSPTADPDVKSFAEGLINKAGSEITQLNLWKGQRSLMGHEDL